MSQTNFFKPGCMRQPASPPSRGCRIRNSTALARKQDTSKRVSSVELASSSKQLRAAIVQSPLSCVNRRKPPSSCTLLMNASLGNHLKPHRASGTLAEFQEKYQKAIINGAMKRTVEARVRCNLRLTKTLGQRFSRPHSVLNLIGDSISSRLVVPNWILNRRTRKCTA